jgi:hypothetical protein
MLEKRIHTELYDQLANYSFSYQGQPVEVTILRAKQAVNDLQFPSIFIDYSDAVLDRGNIPLNEVYSIDLVDAGDGFQDIQYHKGVAVRQSIELNLYDNNIRRIAELQEQLFLLCKQISLTGVTIFEVMPPRFLDFTEEDYVYRRMIEIVCRFLVSWEEIVKTVEEVESSVETQP